MLRSFTLIALACYLLAALVPCRAPQSIATAARAATAAAQAHAGHSHGSAPAEEAHADERPAAFIAKLCHCGCHRSTTAGAPGPLGPVLPMAILAPAPALVARDAGIERITLLPNFPARIDHIPRPA